MADTEIKKCAHAACRCTVTKDEKYCSQHCKDAADTAEIACDCGHPACAI